MTVVDVNAHPVSYTDAWVRVGDTIEVRLNVFLHDVDGLAPEVGDDVRNKAADFSAEVASETVLRRIKRHGRILCERLQLFANGLPLTAELIAAPRWKPRADTVDLLAEGAVRLSWRLKFASVPEDLTTLTIRHGFRGSVSGQTGELRLHLQTASARRISATIPPDRPYTIALSRRPGDSASQDALNQAQSRIIFTPRTIVHEFTAPLSRMSSAADLVADSSDSTRDHISHAVVKGDVADLVRHWFADHVRLFAHDGYELVLLTASTQLFPKGLPNVEAAVQASAVDSTGFDVPLMGTLVGVRQVFRRPDALDTCLLTFDQSPGDFAELTVNTVTAVGESSAIASFCSDTETTDASAAAPALAFKVDAANPDSPSPKLSPAGPTERLVVSKTRLRRSRALVTGIAMITAFAVFLRRTRDWPAIRRTTFATALFVPAAVILGSLSFQRHHDAKPQAARAMFGHVLDRIYRAVSTRDRISALSELGNVLENDLLETTFLDVAKTLDNSDDGALVCVNGVNIDRVQSLQATSESSVVAQVSWQVSGTVYHWGHVHDRVHQLRGRINLSHSSGHWRISSLRLLESKTNLKSSRS